MLNRAHSIVGFHPEDRPENDFYPTPKISTESLLSKIKFNGKIWECACGKGDISEVLINNGYDVISTELDDYKYGIPNVDFLSTKELLAPNIITNPPYRLATEFLEHAIALGSDTVSLFLKLAFLEGTNRQKLFKEHPPKFVYVFSKRQTLTRDGIKMKNSGMIAFAWFYWEKGYTDLPRIDWI